MDRHVGLDPAARRERTDKRHGAGRSDRNQIVQNLIRDRFVERPVISILLKVHFQRLEFITKLIGDVGQRQCTKVRLAGFWTQ